MQILVSLFQQESGEPAVVLYRTLESAIETEASDLGYHFPDAEAIEAFKKELREKRSYSHFIDGDFAWSVALTWQDV